MPSGCVTGRIKAGAEKMFIAEQMKWNRDVCGYCVLLFLFLLFLFCSCGKENETEMKSKKNDQLIGVGGLLMG